MLLHFNKVNIQLFYVQTLLVDVGGSFQMFSLLVDPYLRLETGKPICSIGPILQPKLKPVWRTYFLVRLPEFFNKFQELDEGNITWKLGGGHGFHWIVLSTNFVTHHSSVWCCFQGTAFSNQLFIVSLLLSGNHGNDQKIEHGWIPWMWWTNVVTVTTLW